MNNPDKKAFSLVEALIVMFIILLITGLTVPNYFKFSSSKKLDTVAREVSNVLRSARAHAITNRKNCNVYFYNAGKTYEMRDFFGNLIDKTYKVPDIITIVDGTNPFPVGSGAYKQAEFKPDGSGAWGADTRDVKITDIYSHEKKVTVVGTTGRVKIE